MRDMSTPALPGGGRTLLGQPGRAAASRAWGQLSQGQSQRRNHCSGQAHPTPCCHLYPLQHLLGRLGPPRHCLAKAVGALLCATLARLLAGRWRCSWLLPPPPAGTAAAAAASLCRTALAARYGCWRSGRHLLRCHFCRRRSFAWSGPPTLHGALGAVVVRFSEVHDFLHAFGGRPKALRLSSRWSRFFGPRTLRLRLWSAFGTDGS